MSELVRCVMRGLCCGIPAATIAVLLMLAGLAWSFPAPEVAAPPPLSVGALITIGGEFDHYLVLEFCLRSEKGYSYYRVLRLGWAGSGAERYECVRLETEVIRDGRRIDR